jgi:hypothetical protein
MSYITHPYTLIFRETQPAANDPAIYTRELAPIPGLYGKASIRLAGLFVEAAADAPVEVRVRWGSASRSNAMGTGNPSDTVAVLQSVVATSVPAGEAFRFLPQGPSTVTVSLHNPATGAPRTDITRCVIQLEARVTY